MCMKNSEINKLCKSVSLISAKCSYAIHCTRESQFWDLKKPLLELNSNAVDATNPEKEASQQLPSIDSNTKVQIAQRKKNAESKLAISVMKTKIAQKRKIAEAKLSKSMKNKLNVLPEETSDHKSRIHPKMEELISKRRKIAEAKLEAKAAKRRLTSRIEQNRIQALIRKKKS